MRVLALGGGRVMCCTFTCAGQMICAGALLAMLVRDGVALSNGLGLRGAGLVMGMALPEFMSTLRTHMLGLKVVLQ